MIPFDGTTNMLYFVTENAIWGIPENEDPPVRLDGDQITALIPETTDGTTDIDPSIGENT